VKVLSQDAHIKTIKTRGEGPELVSEVHIELRVFVKRMTLEELQELKDAMRSRNPLRITLQDTEW